MVVNAWASAQDVTIDTTLSQRPAMRPARVERRAPAAAWPDSIAVEYHPDDAPQWVELSEIEPDGALVTDTIAQVAPTGERVRTFNPSPTKAVWMSALCPGLGQLYNRRYWKLPIVIGGFLGLGYATSWNNSMLRDYTRAYFDLMDNDPSTKSYMDFFPSTTKESDLSTTWLESVLKARKNYYRRNRDLCIICMVGVYLLAMVDAYVDASLAHFDITPDLTVDVAPTLIPDARNRPGGGISLALNF